MKNILSILVTIMCALLAIILFDLIEYRFALSHMGQEPVCYHPSNNWKVDCPLKPGADMDFLPPPQYDYLFPGPIIITRKASMNDLNAVCGGNRLLGACGARVAYSCQIFILPDNQLADLVMSFWATIRHEIGHCNGWPADHPGRRHDVPDWYDIPASQLFYGEPLRQQLLELGKRHSKEME